MRGEIVYFYAFDVANEVCLERVRSLLGEKPVPYTLPLGHEAPREIVFPRPLAVEPDLGERIDGRPLRVRVHVHSVGVVSIALRVACECGRLSHLLPCHQPRLDSSRSADALARALCADVVAGLEGALVRPSAIPEPEAYTTFCLSDLDGEGDTARWLADRRREVAGLLNETAPDRLSEAQVGEVLRQQRSFERTDLVVIDWDAALVVDLDGRFEEVLYVLELANLQLEEFRVMDEALDRYLNEAYGHLETRQSTLFGVTSSVVRKLRRFRVDVAKLADEVTHITKFFGDWYLARVYLGARERFHLDEWRASVEGRLAQLDQLYSVVHGDLYERRMFWLEIVIVVFFAVDLVGLFLFRK